MDATMLWPLHVKIDLILSKQTILLLKIKFCHHLIQSFILFLFIASYFNIIVISVYFFI
jgi:hypothetical protein